MQVGQENAPLAKNVLDIDRGSWKTGISNYHQCLRGAATYWEWRGNPLPYMRGEDKCDTIRTTRQEHWPHVWGQCKGSI
jgi:hypothetical protein